jgi:signal transduction histidine kinase
MRQIQRTALDFCASYTKSAIGVFEPTSDGEVSVILPQAQFEPYCRKIRASREGDRLCRADHIRRTKQIMASGRPSLMLCHAGVFNQALPIVVAGRVRAVLMYGQMKVRGDPRYEEALNRHEAIIADLEPTEDEELELRVFYDDIKQLSREDLVSLNQQLSLLQRLFYRTLSGEEESDKQTENTIHDLQTRLQPILSQAEKLVEDLRELEAAGGLVEEVLAAANKQVQAVKALRVPIWNLGSFMPDYRFEVCPLRELVEEAIVLYGAEAERKEIAIRTQLPEPTAIAMSRVHLQQAINNLLHNAIKYSFYGRYDLDRFVEVEGETDGLDYVLTFSNYGVGILPKEYGLIFEPGYKGELTRGEYRSGSGMGLAIVKRIVEKHYGTIEVESRRKGRAAYRTRLIVRLPRSQYVIREEAR